MRTQYFIGIFSIKYFFKPWTQYPVHRSFYISHSNVTQCHWTQTKCSVFLYTTLTLHFMLYLKLRMLVCQDSLSQWHICVSINVDIWHPRDKHLCFKLVGFKYIIIHLFSVVNSVIVCVVIMVVHTFLLNTDDNWRRDLMVMNYVSEKWNRNTQSIHVYTF